MTHESDREDILRPVVDEAEVEQKTRKKLLDMVEGIIEVGLEHLSIPPLVIALPSKEKASGSKGRAMVVKNLWTKVTILRTSYIPSHSFCSETKRFLPRWFPQLIHPADSFLTTKGRRKERNS